VTIATTTTTERLRAPFSYFGAKVAIASEVWERFGDPRIFLEPFCGSAAVLLGRPGGAPDASHLKIINDLDGHIANVWRAIKLRPGEIADAMSEGVREVDLHARAAVAHERTADLVARLEGDPAYCDVELASWWVHGSRGSIPGNWLSPGPWHREVGADGVFRLVEGAPGCGVGRRRPGHNAPFGGLNAEPERWMNVLAERLRRVTILSGDWRTGVSRFDLDGRSRPGVRAIFLDPPYSTKHSECYRVDEAGVAEQVREWCQSADPAWRIALCGYSGEHEQLEQEGWSVLPWRSHPGFGHDRTSVKERIWFSPACVQPDTGPAQMDLFPEAS